MVAVWQGRTEVVSLLLAAGANIDLQNEVRACLTCRGSSRVKYLLATFARSFKI